MKSWPPYVIEPFLAVWANEGIMTATIWAANFPLFPLNVDRPKLTFWALHLTSLLRLLCELP